MLGTAALAVALVLIAASAVLGARQRRMDARSPLLPCDRCGRLSPAAALYPDRGPGGEPVERCADCEWPGGV